MLRGIAGWPADDALPPRFVLLSDVFDEPSPARHHPNEIAWGCHIAVQIAKRTLTAHSRMVRAEMDRRALVSDVSGPEFWMGAVFKTLKDAGILKETGQRFKYSDSSRGIHEREVKIWALVENADTTKYDKAPDEEPET